MRRTTGVLLIILCLLFVCGCKDSKTKEPSNYISAGAYHTDCEGVTMRIVNSGWNEEGPWLETEWENNTSSEVFFGAAFQIQRLNGNEWEECTSADPYFIEIAYVLSAGKTQNKTYYPGNIYDIFEPGAYRLMTTCSLYEEEAELKECNLIAEFTVDYVPHSATVNTMATATEVPFTAQYIRTNGGTEDINYPGYHFVNSTQELAAYYDAYKDVFYLDRVEKVYSDTTIGFLDACDGYDDAFFEKNCLLLVLVEEGSGSIRHEVLSITTFEEVLSVDIHPIVPEVGTEDMAQWHIIIELPKTCADMATEILFDGKSSQSEATTEAVDAVLQSPPDLEILLDSGTYTASKGGYSWTYTESDGTSCSVIADALHPLQFELEPLISGMDYGKLSFALSQPDSVGMVCWPESQRTNENVESISVPVSDLCFDIHEGSYIYELQAKWDKGGYSGTVSYVFWIVRDEHFHMYASEPQTVSNPITGYCGNTITKVHLGNEDHSFWGSKSVAMTDLLINLEYDPNMICNCVPEFTVDTEFGTGYGVNLSEGYVRCSKGQVSLTPEQIDTIEEILSWIRQGMPQ